MAKGTLGLKSGVVMVKVTFLLNIDFDIAKGTLFGSIVPWEGRHVDDSVMVIMTL